MAQQVNRLSAKLDDLSLVPRIPWWRELTLATCPLNFTHAPGHVCMNVCICVRAHTRLKKAKAWMPEK